MASVTKPDTTRLLEVLVRLHDDVRQIQYPYSAKVLKWGLIQHSEIEAVLKADPSASEQTLWAGHKKADVALRLAGHLTRYIDHEGYREKWMEAGLAEGSWKTFLSMYCRLKADSAPFDSDEYHRNDELDNLLSLVQILDEEVFSHPEMAGQTNLAVTMKSKWWKECHRVFAEAVREEVYRGLGLAERPKEGLCYTPKWTTKVQNEIRKIARRWRKSPLWDQPQSTDKSRGVDFTNNNEATVKEFLVAHGFSTAYLEGR